MDPTPPRRYERFRVAGIELRGINEVCTRGEVLEAIHHMGTLALWGRGPDGWENLGMVRRGRVPELAAVNFEELEPWEP